MFPPFGWSGDPLPSTNTTPQGTVSGPIREGLPHVCFPAARGTAGPVRHNVRNGRKPADSDGFRPPHLPPSSFNLSYSLSVRQCDSDRATRCPATPYPLSHYCRTGPSRRTKSATIGRIWSCAAGGGAHTRAIARQRVTSKPAFAPLLAGHETPVGHEVGHGQVVGGHRVARPCPTCPTNTE